DGGGQKQRRGRPPGRIGPGGAAPVEVARVERPPPGREGAPREAEPAGDEKEPDALVSRPSEIAQRVHQGTEGAETLERGELRDPLLERRPSSGGVGDERIAEEPLREVIQEHPDESEPLEGFEPREGHGAPTEPASSARARRFFPS